MNGQCGAGLDSELIQNPNVDEELEEAKSNGETGQEVVSRWGNSMGCPGDNSQRSIKEKKLQMMKLNERQKNLFGDVKGTYVS